MESELQKILDRISEGSLTLDKARDELSKIETHSDREVMTRKILVDRLSSILVLCTVLMDDLHQLVEGEDEIPSINVEGWDEDFN